MAEVVVGEINRKVTANIPTDTTDDVYFIIFDNMKLVVYAHHPSLSLCNGFGIRSWLYTLGPIILTESPCASVHYFRIYL